MQVQNVHMATIRSFIWPMANCNFLLNVSILSTLYIQERPSHLIMILDMRFDHEPPSMNKIK